MALHNNQFIERNFLEEVGEEVGSAPYFQQGRRITTIVNGTITEKYLWQGQTRLLAIYDGSNNLITRFNYADGRMPVSMTSGGNTYYLTYDQVGSLRLITDSSGNVVKRVDYDSFGNIIADTNPGFNVMFGFAGGLQDPDTGLVRFGYRDYNPDTGRWTAKDPILFAGGDTDLYGYVLNDPIMLVDPWGLKTQEEINAFNDMMSKEVGEMGDAAAVYAKIMEVIDKFFYLDVPTKVVEKTKEKIDKLKKDKKEKPKPCKL